MKRRAQVHGAWYAAALVPFAIGMVVTVLRIRGLTDAVAHMPRTVVPGKTEITLAAGDHVVYGETRSVFRDVGFVAPSLQLRCGVVAPATGGAVELGTPSRPTSYSTGEFAGQSMFTLTVPQAGVYQLDCEGRGGPATVAFGSGIGTQITGTRVGVPGGALGSAVVAVLVHRQRTHAARATERSIPSGSAS
jgi:hypothetical protein